MTIHQLAGKLAPKSILTNIPLLISSYYTTQPDLANKEQIVAFGTSGHRGSSIHQTFNENHILAITAAICLYRQENKISGPLFIGMDTHALSEPAMITAIEVLAAYGVTTMVQPDHGYTPTPGISHAILTYNRNRQEGLADGIVVTPSHNPPTDGGFKYNPPNGGPADTQITNWIAAKANELLKNPDQIKRIPYARAIKAPTTIQHDYITPYVHDLANVIDMAAIKKSGLKIGADALGGAALGFWEPIAHHYNLNIEILNGYADPTFSFMCVDHDGKIRMDCSSPHAMAGLIHLKDKYDIAFGNDADSDRHGIVTRSVGLMNPNHYLAVAIQYLFKTRKNWRQDAAIGKTLVSSSMIDRVAKKLGRNLAEVPVGFKWFVDGLVNGSFGFGGEESAGASFLRHDGTVWTTDKDGIILNLLAAEITATTGRDPGEHYRDLEKEFGAPVYERIDVPATPAQKSILGKLSPEMIKAEKLAGEPIIAKLTKAPANGASIGGLKVVTENGWFAARPSGTENVYKIYAESFNGPQHLKLLQDEAKKIIDKAFSSAN